MLCQLLTAAMTWISRRSRGSVAIRLTSTVVLVGRWPWKNSPWIRLIMSWSSARCVRNRVSETTYRRWDPHYVVARVEIDWRAEVRYTDRQLRVRIEVERAGTTSLTTREAVLTPTGATAAEARVVTVLWDTGVRKPMAFSEEEHARLAAHCPRPGDTQAGSQQLSSDGPADAFDNARPWRA